jgi:HEAT repeat protein
MLGVPNGLSVAARAAESRDPADRARAALALGAINRLEAQPLLAGLLKDADPQVRIAAAHGVLSLH